MENETETSKNSVDQIFTGENKNKRIFLLFSRFTCFVNGIFLVYGSIIWFCYQTYLTKKSEELPLACLYLKFSLSYGYPHLLLYRSCDYVKRFVRVLVLLVINTGCPKNLLKMGNTAL